MTDSYQGYTYRIDFRQVESGAWFANIAIARPDGSSLGPYSARATHRQREFVRRDAQEFVMSEITKDSERNIAK
jgi:hypothetical protein